MLYGVGKVNSINEALVPTVLGATVFEVAKALPVGIEVEP